MGTNSRIEWTTHTWNPWQGCHKISSGCKNCYMFRDKARYGQEPNKVARSAPATFNKPLHWKDPTFVFSCSWSDFFIEEADPWRGDAWDIIRKTPHLTYQILTKRPVRTRQCLPTDWGNGWPNVWLGVTAEDENTVWRIPQALVIPADKHFVSVEPMLSAADLRPWLFYEPCLDWVICGCESGPGARPTELDWVRGLRDQCIKAGVPFLLKQLSIGGKLVKMPELDDQVWAQMPEVSHER